jgi:hypothetical protein
MRPRSRNDTSREGDFSGRILSLDRNSPAGSDCNERSQAVSFHRTLELGVSERQLNRVGSGSESVKRKRAVHFSGWPTSKVTRQR